MKSLLSAMIVSIMIVLCGTLPSLAGPNNGPTASHPAVDGEQVYKTNCTRCHNTPPSLTQLESKVVVLHMRVRANLLADQANAVLQYLTESARK